MPIKIIAVEPIKFELGQIVATPGALELCKRLAVDPATLFLRHARGDWGDLDDFDLEQNRLALINGDRLLSAYIIGPGEDDKVWLITEASREVSTILLPSDY